jgi:hypothetical protein
METEDGLEAIWRYLEDLSEVTVRTVPPGGIVPLNRKTGTCLPALISSGIRPVSRQEERAKSITIDIGCVLDVGGSVWTDQKLLKHIVDS